MSESPEKSIATQNTPEKSIAAQTTPEKSIVTSSNYYPVVSMHVLTLHGDRRKKYYSTEVTDIDVDKKKYTNVTLIDLPIFETEKDGIYIKPKKPDGYVEVSIDLVKQIFPDDVNYLIQENKIIQKWNTFRSAIDAINDIHLCTKIPDSMKCVTFEGYLLQNGKFISAEFIDLPISVTRHLPYRHKSGKFIYYSNDKGKKLRNKYDPYIHGLRVKKID
jgi:hypothetical protein